MARRLHRLGLFTAHHKWVVLGAWLILVGGMATALHTFGSNTTNNLDLPGTDSQAASDLLAARFPPQQNGKSPIVFHAPDHGGGKVTDAANKEAIQQSHSAILEVPHVNSATSAWWVAQGELQERHVRQPRSRHRTGSVPSTRSVSPAISMWSR